MRDRWESWRTRWTTASPAAPTTRWQKQLLDIFLLATLAAAVAIMVVNGSQWLIAPDPMAVSYVASDAVACLALVGLWLLNRTGRTRLVSYIYLTLQIAAGSAAFSLESLDRVLLIYALPTLMASFLIAPFWSFVLAALSILAYTLTYFTGGAVVSYNYVAVPMLLVLATIAWLIASRLRQAMDTAMQEVTAHKQAEEQVRHQAETLAALHETSLDLTAQRTLPDLLRAIVARAAGLLGAKGGGIYLYRPASDDLEYVYIFNKPPSFVGSILQRGEGLSGQVLATGRPLTVSDHDRWEGRSPQHTGQAVGVFVAVPIVWGERFLGVLDLETDAPRTFTPEDIDRLERLAPLAAAALENHRLLQDLQRRMEELQTTQEQLIQSAKMAAIGNLAAGVAHEVNNPMTIVMGFAEMLMAELPADSAQRQDLQRILAEASRVRRIVHALLDFSRQTKPCRQPADVNEVVRQVLLLVGEQLAGQGITVSEDYAPNLDAVPLDEGQIRQVLLHLVYNAAQVMPQGGRLGIRTLRAGAEVAIAVSDTGSGVPSNVQEHLFDPFFTTNPAERSGLGLSVSLGIVKEHGGRIEVETAEGKGSTFTVWLPGEG
jgi:signal transduction histidine kinase